MKMNNTLFKKMYAMLCTVLYHNTNNSSTGSLTLWEVNNIAQNVQDFINENFVARSVHNWSVISDEYLRSIALDSRKCNEFYQLNEKINCIKHLRYLTNVGLKQAKEAVEAAYKWEAYKLI